MGIPFGFSVSDLQTAIRLSLSLYNSFPANHSTGVTELRQETQSLSALLLALERCLLSADHVSQQRGQQMTQICSHCRNSLEDLVSIANKMELFSTHEPNEKLKTTFRNHCQKVKEALMYFFGQWSLWQDDPSNSPYQVFLLIWFGEPIFPYSTFAQSVDREIERLPGGFPQLISFIGDTGAGKSTLIESSERIEHEARVRPAEFENHRCKTVNKWDWLFHDLTTYAPGFWDWSDAARQNGHSTSSSKCDIPKSSPALPALSEVRDTVSSIPCDSLRSEKRYGNSDGSIESIWEHNTGDASNSPIGTEHGLDYATTGAQFASFIFSRLLGLFLRTLILAWSVVLGLSVIRIRLLGARQSASTSSSISSLVTLLLICPASAAAGAEYSSELAHERVGPTLYRGLKHCYGRKAYNLALSGISLIIHPSQLPQSLGPLACLLLLSFDVGLIVVAIRVRPKDHLQKFILAGCAIIASLTAAIRDAGIVEFLFGYLFWGCAGGVLISWLFHGILISNRNGEHKLHWTELCAYCLPWEGACGMRVPPDNAGYRDDVSSQSNVNEKESIAIGTDGRDEQKI